MIKKTLLIGSLLIITNSCKRINEVQNENPKIVFEFFKEYDKDPDNALNNIFKSNDWLKSNISTSQKDSLVSQISSITKLLGNFNGYEILKVIDAGDSFKVISTIAKYERQPVRFNFLLYKPESEWQVQNFTYDLNIEEELMNNTNLSFDF